MATSTTFAFVALLCLLGASGSLATYDPSCPEGSLCKRCMTATNYDARCKYCNTERCMLCLANKNIYYKDYCLDNPPRPGAKTCRDETCVACLAAVDKHTEPQCLEVNNHLGYGCVMKANSDTAKLCKYCNTESCVSCVLSPYGVYWKELCTYCTSERCVNCLKEPAKEVTNELLCLDGICKSEACVRCLASKHTVFNEYYCPKCTSEACVQCVIDSSKAYQSAADCYKKN